MLQFKKRYFFVNASGISCQAAICAYYTMTGNDNRNFVVANCTAYSLCRHMRKLLHFSYFSCNLSICDRLPIRNL